MTRTSVAAVARDPDELRRRLDRLELVLTAGAGQLDRRTLAAARRVRRRAGQRLGLAGEHTVVALAGGTGSGKSTLFNALTGLDLSATGARRPTTQAPYACVWGPDHAADLLDWLEVPADRRVARESALDAGTDPPLPGLILLDLPDHDSVEVTHRLEVDRLIELVDVLVWVLDPEKYSDDAVHRDYLRPLHTHADVMIVILNQADRLPAGQAQACVADLRRLLAEDGIGGVRTLATSAVTGAGVADLRDLLTAAVVSRQATLRRLGADLDALGPRLRLAARPPLDPAGVDGLAEVAAAALVDLVGVDRIAAQVSARDMAVGRRRTGWPPLAWREKAPPAPALGVPPAAVEQVARGTAAAISGTGEPWRTRLEDRALDAAPGLVAALDRAVEDGLATAAEVPGAWAGGALTQRVLLAVAVLGLVLAAIVSAPAGIGLVVASLGAGWAAGDRAGRAVAAGAEGRRQVLADRLRGDIAGLTRELLIAPMQQEVAGYNDVQRALHDVAGPIRLNGG